MWIEHELVHPNIGTLIKQAKDLDVQIRYMSRPELDRAVKGGKHGGIAIRAAFDPAATFSEWVQGLDDARKKGLVVVVLDQIQDPRNLGAVARVAEAVGATGLVIPERRSAEVTPAACKASAGAVEYLPVAQVRNIADFLDDAKKAGAWAYGAAAAAPALYDEPDYSGRVVLVMGSEGKGLRPRVAEHCDQLISLPIRGRMESLNVSTAAAAILYGILQSRRKS
jgi:23S rRNA (guanosine2251-2'-O)-methyltransferase